MVVEHTFITTLSDQEALGAATALLNSRGFTAVGERAFAMDGTWTNIELTRGKTNPARAKSITDLPQNVRIEFDRGRICMAASLTPWSRGGREQIPGEITTRSVNKPHPLQQELLLALVAAVELLLVQRQPPHICTSRLDHVELEIHEFARRMRRRHWTIGLIVLALIAAAIGLIWYAASDPY
jgi:hypothetical protein